MPLVNGSGKATGEVLADMVSTAGAIGFGAVAMVDIAKDNLNYDCAASRRTARFIEVAGVRDGGVFDAFRFRDGQELRYNVREGY